jgi:hypothetical protein
MRKEVLVEQPRNLRGTLCTIDFGTRWEPIDDMASIWIPHNCKHELLLWISVLVLLPPHFWPESTLDEGQGEAQPGLIAGHQMSPTVFSHRFSIDNH